MQQGITPMPDVDDFDPNVDPGANRGLGRVRNAEDGSTNEDVPLPPDVKDRESIEGPSQEPSSIEVPFEPPPKPLL